MYHHIDKQEATPVHNIEAEQTILGTLLLNNDALTGVASILDPEHFYDPLHGEIFGVIRGMVNEGRIASPITLRSVMESHAGLGEIGGPGYFVKLAGVGSSSNFINDYAQMVVDLAVKREILRDCEDAREKINSGKESGAAIAVDLESRLGKVAADNTVKPLVKSYLGGMISTIERLNEAYQNVEGVGVTTGLNVIDKKLGKMRAGQMILLAGRSSMGKTTIAQRMIMSAAQSGEGVFFASLEMPREELTARFLSMGLHERGVKLPYNKIIRGDMSETQFREVIDQSKRTQDLPIITGERECRDMQRLRSAARQAQREFEKSGKPLRLICIDYAQLLSSRTATRSYDRVSEASDFIKTLAMDFDVPVLALSQLSREVERRDPPVPQLSDLRESGKLEEDADVVMLAYRPAYYLDRKREAAKSDEERSDLFYDIEKQRFDLKLIIAKQRNGPTGETLAFIEPAFCAVMNERPTNSEELI